MDRLAALLDQRKSGTHYSDRMQRILHVCEKCGILWHEERVAFRDGSTERRRVDDVVPTNQVYVTSQYEKYGLRVNPRILPRLERMASQFAYALNVSSASVEIDGDTVYVRVPRAVDDATQMVSFEDAWRAAPNVPQGSLLLGVDEDQRQLVVRLVAPTNVHAAVIGMTGSGKSTLMKTMILSAQHTGRVQVALFDPSGGFRALSGHPSVWRGGVFESAGDCELGLQALVDGMGKRCRNLIYAFVDEVPELVAQRPAARKLLARLAQSGRHAGVHLVLGAQHLLASQVGSMTLRNVPLRIVGRVADATAAYHATGRRDTGAEQLRGRGDFIVVNGSTLCHFQAARIESATLTRWERRYPPKPPSVPVRRN